MRKSKAANIDWERDRFIIEYLETNYGESWHEGNYQTVEKRYKEAIQEYEKVKKG